MAEIKMPHPGHEKHLCFLNNLRFHISDPQEYRSLVKDPKYLCQNCGRVAASDKNLCKPVEL